MTRRQSLLALLAGLAMTLAWGPGRAQAEQAAPSASEDEAVLRKLVAEQAEAWNRHDAKAWSKDFAPEADFVNIFGMVFRGREEIEARHAAIFATIFKDSRTEVTVRRLVFLSEGMAVLDTEHAVRGYGKLPPTVHPVDGVLLTRMKYVMKKTPEGWRVIAGQNTDVKPPPPGKGAAPGKGTAKKATP